MSETATAYGQLLDAGASLAASGHYEAAFHALMAAMHCALDDGDAGRLGEVAGLLRRYGRDVDALRPPHKLSAWRCHTGRTVFEIGASQADSAAETVNSRRRAESLMRRIHLNTPWPSG